MFPRGGHAKVFVLGRHPDPDFARAMIAGDDRATPLAIGGGGIKTVEPQLRFASLFIWTMTTEASARQDRTDLTLEIDRLADRIGCRSD
jgi:hypothetical protein